MAVSFVNILFLFIFVLSKENILADDDVTTKQLNLYIADKHESFEMTTVEDDLNVPKKMKANKIISEYDDRFKTDTNSSEFEEAENETCVGDPQYCNMTKEEYVKMIQEYIYPNPYEWILIATHTFVFITGLFGNALVCVAVYRNHSMRTVTNYFIVNLAVADFMVILFCLPATVLWDVTETWFLGEGLCKVLPYFQSVSVTVSVLTLTFISVDRWYAICFPLKFKSTTGRAKTAILIIWLVSLCFNIPELVVLKLVRFVPLRFELPYLLQCYGTWSPSSELVWHILKVLLIYTLPLVLMAVAYHQIARVLWSSNGIPGQADTKKLATAELTQLRSRRKAAKMLVSVVIMFAVCYFPVHLLSVMRYTIDMGQTEFITIWALVSHVMCYANSAINPLIYNLMSDKFRREFRRAFCCSTSPGQQDFTSMSRVTTKKDSSIMASFKPGHTSTTFVHNNKNGHMT